MRYLIHDENRIQILSETKKINEILLTIAKVSYKTATPREFGSLNVDEEVPDLSRYIESENGKPKMLLMDYINDRDCRTKVFKAEDGQWYLDSYAFKQRKVTSQEFCQGIVRDEPATFLDKVIEELSQNRGL